MNTNESLVTFARLASPEALDALQTYLQLRAEDYRANGFQQARDGGKGWLALSVASFNSAHALLALSESIILAEETVLWQKSE